MYSILRTDLFADQLTDIVSYIADDTGSPKIALDVLDRIEKDILRLGDFPDSGSIPRNTLLRRRGFRVLITLRWLMLYKVDHTAETVTLYAIADHKQEYEHMI